MVCKMVKKKKRNLHPERGASIIEYLLILTVIMVAAIPLRNLGTHVGAEYQRADDRITELTANTYECAGGTYEGSCQPRGGPSD